MNAPHLTPIASALSLALFYDTETTGLPLWSDPSEDPRQPHIVQLAACLVDLTSRKIISTLDAVIKPNGWTIPDEVAAIHGISTERAMDVGVPEALAVEMLLEMVGKRPRIAHNESFDARIVRIGVKRFFDDLMADEWKAGPAACTQVLATPICKLPPTAKMIAAKRNHFKSANLGEAYRHFTGRELQNAHSALADVHGCIEVFFGIEDLKKQALAA